MQIETIAGKKVAIGLDWRFLPGEISEAKEMAAIAKQENVNFGVLLRGDEAIVVGLANAGKGAVSGAAWICKAVPVEGVVLFEPLGDGEFWLCATQGGSPVPGYDLVGRLEDVVAKAHDLLSYQSSFKVFAPQGIYPGAEDGDFASLIKSVSYKQKIGRISGVPASHYALAALAVAVTVGCGLFYQSQKASIQKLNAQKIQEQIKLDFSNSVTEAKARAQSEVEREMLAVSDFIAMPAIYWQVYAWMEAIKGIDLTIAGWAVDKIDCALDRCQVTWKRLPLATVGDFDQETSNRKEKKIDPDVAFMAVPVKKQVARPAIPIDGLPEWEGIRLDRVNTFQLIERAGMEVKLSLPAEKKTIRIVDKDGKDVDKPIALPFSFGTWEVSGKKMFEPETVARDLIWTNFVVDRFTVSFKGMQDTNWKLEGRYVVK